MKMTVAQGQQVLARITTLLDSWGGQILLRNTECVKQPFTNEIQALFLTDNWMQE